MKKLLRLSEPANVTEVLTVWKQRVLGIHAASHLEASRIVNALIHLERIQIAFVFDYIERRYVVNMVVAIRIGTDGHHFDTDGIIQALLVYNDACLVTAAAYNVPVKL